ncbi:unnamed protein product [Clonostachys rosea]|uniref:Zn(2)-C6 fungal-type domain-containing protein n=1 Tax=Bionectria ochroleuca TaxID=29856 RepID=A0ABY6UJ66_BIOOC|nr:unnamed protein product [Clonostachys rosea]
MPSYVPAQNEQANQMLLFSPRQDKKKCDEVRPNCARCLERRQECVYEPVKPRQRRKRDSLSLDTTKANAARPDRALQIHTPLSAVSVQQWESQQQRWRDGVDGQGDDSSSDGSRRTGGIEATESVVLDDRLGQLPLPTSTTGNDLETYFTSWTPADTTAVFSPITTPSFDLASLDGCSAAHDNDRDVEEVIRRDSAAVATALTLTHNHHHHHEPTPFLEFCSPSFAEFSGQKNRRFLVDHFCNVLSHLIVFREENGNPFQQLVLPLCHRSPAVMDAVYALASAHLEFRGVDPGEKSDIFHGKAIQELAGLIERGSKQNHENRNELLAAIMLIVYFEVLVQRGRSNIVDGHLKGAMTLINNSEASSDPTSVFLERAFGFYDVIAALSFGTAPLSPAPGRGQLSPLPPLDPRGAPSASSGVDTLLGMATTLWPIIHRLSTLVSLKAELESATTQGQVSKVAVLRTELETTTAAIQVALTQWQPMLPPEDVSSSSEPETLKERSRLRSIVNNAHAYRHSAFVYLYRTIRKYPRSHALVQQHTRLSLQHCMGTVSNEGPMSALLWPLFVAACEATDEADRDLARQSFVAIDRRQGMANIDRAWTVVQEVWRRADDEEKEEEAMMAAMMLMRDATGDMASRKAGEGPNGAMLMAERNGMMMRGAGGDLWRRVSRDMGLTIVFG